jgi:hypothetical protein
MLFVFKAPKSGSPSALHVAASWLLVCFVVMLRYSAFGLRCTCGDASISGFVPGCN